MLTRCNFLRSISMLLTTNFSSPILSKKFSFFQIACFQYPPLCKIASSKPKTTIPVLRHKRSSIFTVLVYTFLLTKLKVPLYLFNTYTSSKYSAPTLYVMLYDVFSKRNLNLHVQTRWVGCTCSQIWADLNGRFWILLQLRCTILVWIQI